MGYDVTKYLNQHEGGAGVFEDRDGTDATQAFLELCGGAGNGEAYSKLIQGPGMCVGKNNPECLRENANAENLERLEAICKSDRCCLGCCRNRCHDKNKPFKCGPCGGKGWVSEWCGYSPCKACDRVGQIDPHNPNYAHNMPKKLEPSGWYDWC